MYNFQPDNLLLSPQERAAVFFKASYKLNDYAEAIVSSIHEHAGDVLKLIGDGVLAIFPAEERSRACASRGCSPAGRG